MCSWTRVSFSFSCGSPSVLIVRCDTGCTIALETLNRVEEAAVPGSDQTRNVALVLVSAPEEGPGVSNPDNENGPQIQRVFLLESRVTFSFSRLRDCPAPTCSVQER